MRMFSVLLLSLLLVVIIRFIWLVQMRRYPKKEAVYIIADDMKNIAGSIKKGYWIYTQRQMVFMVYQDVRPFEETIKNLSICKYFKFSHLVELNRDILELHFVMLSISSGYSEKTPELATLLEKLFQDFYIERLGMIQYPLVHITNIQEGEAVFWVAKNAHGNLIVQQRAYTDERRDIPNTEELLDD